MSTKYKSNPAGRRKWGLVMQILSIHTHNNININIHIDIDMNIDITPHIPPHAGAVCRRGREGHGEGRGWGDMNIHTDINMNIDIHIIMNMNIEN